jgi:hypothetical protein
VPVLYACELRYHLVPCATGEGLVVDLIEPHLIEIRAHIAASRRHKPSFVKR